MGRNGHRWDRLAVVVGGVTTTQGAWESHAQGEGPKTPSSNPGTHIEVLDLMVDVTTELGHLKKLAEGDPTKRFDRLYRAKAKRVKKGTGHVAQSGMEQHTKLLCHACHMAHHHHASH